MGDMFGRVRMYNLGFAIFTVGCILLSVTWLHGSAGALWMIVMRIVQGIGAAFLFANSSAILTDAFGANERGLALGINMVAAIAGSFIGLVLGGVLAPLAWRLVFLVSVPIGVLGTVWAYLMLEERGVRSPSKIDWWGNLTFAVGLIAVLVGITYGILPYGGHDMGWTNPKVIAEIAGGLAVLVVFVVIERRVSAPMFHIPLFKIRAFSAGVFATLLSALVARRPDVHADHLATGDLAARARLQLLPDTAVGGHLHAAVVGRVPDRRAFRRAPRRPFRRAPVHHRGHDPRRRVVSAADLAARQRSPTGPSRW